MDSTFSDRDDLRDWTTDAETLLRELVPAGGPLRALKPDLYRDESEWFVRGWESGLYPVSSCPSHGIDVCAPDRLDHFVTTTGKHRHLLTRWSRGGWGLSREYVTHLAAYARAVLEFGYSVEGALLSHYGQYRRDLVTRHAGASYEIDAAFPSADGSTWVLIEAKADPKDVDRWASAIDRGAEPRELIDLGFKEVEYVLEFSPQNLWLVGPGTVEPAAHVWSVSVDDLSIHFLRIPDVPPPPQF